VLDEKGRLAGIITDGDLRRLLKKKTSLEVMVARDIMTHNPKTVHAGTLASQVLEMMEDLNIMQMIVVDAEHRPIGMAHLHDLLKAGVA
jgi:arabinose-5-phosphate isomerase